jgi:hypothetical protein
MQKKLQHVVLVLFINGFFNDEISGSDSYYQMAE